jgi:hypothetical protein
VFGDCYGALVCLPDGILTMLGNGKVYYGLLECLETGLLLIGCYTWPGYYRFDRASRDVHGERVVASVIRLTSRGSHSKEIL